MTDPRTDVTTPQESDFVTTIKSIRVVTSVKIIETLACGHVNEYDGTVGQDLLPGGQKVLCVKCYTAAMQSYAALE